VQDFKKAGAGTDLVVNPFSRYGKRIAWEELEWLAANGRQLLQSAPTPREPTLRAVQITSSDPPPLPHHAPPARSRDMAGDDGCARVPCDLPHDAHRHGAAEIGKAETAEVTARGEQVEAQWLQRKSKRGTSEMCMCDVGLCATRSCEECTCLGVSSAMQAMLGRTDGGAFSISWPVRLSIYGGKKEA
jgi:hypothetical protein